MSERFVNAHENVYFVSKCRRRGAKVKEGAPVTRPVGVLDIYIYIYIYIKKYLYVLFNCLDISPPLAHILNFIARLAPTYVAQAFKLASACAWL